MNHKIQRLISVARGQEPADLILANARIVNVFTGEIETGDVAIAEGMIAGIGDYTEAKQIIDLQYDFLLPGLINGHVHIESSLLDVAQYAQAVSTHGTTTVVTDLHEIANVSGMKGMNYVLEKAQNLPLDLYFMAPSCVPATHLETSGATIRVTEIKQMLRWKQCRGLGEMMNYPGVLFADKTVLAKIAAAAGKTVDGHAPGLG
ncbi:MAG: amidohydrolase family protein, partial [Dehalococcoidales bacterium]|nr:amidohydrolase family protein [Dehalococcoidales bacterium]